MSYQVIARKWRPQNFDQLVGQDHITVTLRNALRTGRLHHALLFTGPRGTGKTSSARILAKSIRCPNAVDFVPCDHCPSCEEIAQGRSVDVIEIDGASNNGVEAVRELRDTVAFMPAVGRFKVYIIDEVHMLSTAAFNALLKTLEEPPDHVIFVFATTEVQKIPATIMSRCQRFDFRRISTRVIAERLQLICRSENVKFSEDALWLIARQGDGSMRDSQSLLDQVITFAGPDLHLETVTQILGLTDHQLVKEALSAVIHRQPVLLGPLLQKMSKIAVDPALFLQKIIEDLRHLTMVKIFDQDASQMIDLPDSDLRSLKDLSVLITEPDLQILFDMALKSAQDVNRASEPQWALEMSLLRLASAPRWVDYPRLYEALEGGSSVQPIAATTAPATTSSSLSSTAAVPSGALTPTSSSTAVPRSPPGNTNAPNNSPSATRQTLPNAAISTANSAPKNSTPATPTIEPLPKERLAAMDPQDRWFEFVQKLKYTDSLLSAKLEPLFFIRAEQGKLELAIPANKAFLRDQLTEAATRQKIESLIEHHWGSRYAFELRTAKEQVSAPSAQSLAQQKAKAAEDELIEKAQQNSKVATFNRVFQGRVQGVTAPKNTKE